MWEMLVAQKVCSDEQILQKLSTRFRLKIADVAQIDAKVKEGSGSSSRVATASCRSA